MHGQQNVKNDTAMFHSSWHLMARVCELPCMGHFSHDFNVTQLQTYSFKTLSFLIPLASKPT